MFKQRKLLGLVAGVAFAHLAWSAPVVAAPFYEGKTVTILVGYGAGGASDLTARNIVQHLGQYVPGNPELIVQNMTGGGGIKAFNFLYERAKPDGLTLQFGAFSPISQVVGAPGLRVKFDELTVAGATVTPGGLVMYARSDAVPGGLTRATDLTKATDIKLAGIGPGAIPDVVGRLTLMALDTPFRYIPGYRGSIKVVSAVRTGEASMGIAPLSTYRQVIEPNMVSTGDAKGLMQWSILDAEGKDTVNKYIPELPVFEDVYREIHGKDPSGLAYEALKFNMYILGNASHLLWGPPGMPKEAVDAMRQGMKKAMSDPKLIEQQIKLSGYPQNWADPEVAQEVVKTVTTVSPELKQFMVDFFNAGKAK